MLYFAFISRPAPKDLSRLVTCVSNVTIPRLSCVERIAYLEKVLRWLPPATMDLRKRPALTESDFLSLFKCQQWTLGGTNTAAGIRLQIDCSGTLSTGHGTGDMTVVLISFLLLTQACDVIEPTRKCAAADFTGGKAYNGDVETFLRWLLPATMDLQKFPVLMESRTFCRSSTANNGRWTALIQLLVFGYKLTAAALCQQGMRPVTWQWSLSFSCCAAWFFAPYLQMVPFHNAGCTPVFGILCL